MPKWQQIELDWVTPINFQFFDALWKFKSSQSRLESLSDIGAEKGELLVCIYYDPVFKISLHGQILEASVFYNKVLVTLYGTQHMKNMRYGGGWGSVHILPNTNPAKLQGEFNEAPSGCKAVYWHSAESPKFGDAMEVVGCHCSAGDLLLTSIV